jgi:hypothetical protein
MGRIPSSLFSFKYALIPVARCRIRGRVHIDSGGEVADAARCAAVARGNHAQRMGKTDFATTINT